MRCPRVTNTSFSRFCVAGILVFVIMGSIESTGRTDTNGTWPVRDDDGYYMSYKEGGKWVNWWGRNRPGFMKFATRFFMARDLSGIPSSKEELDMTLPVCVYTCVHIISSIRVQSPSKQDVCMHFLGKNTKLKVNAIIHIRRV